MQRPRHRADVKSDLTAMSQGESAIIHSTEHVIGGSFWDDELFDRVLGKACLSLSHTVLKYGSSLTYLKTLARYKMLLIVYLQKWRIWSLYTTAIAK